MGEFERDARIIRERKERAKEALGKEASNELMKKFKIGINTTMIGALNDFEEYFGHMWGHGVESPSEDQKEIQQSWQAVRESILDRGNDSIGKSEYHIGRFDIQYKEGKRLQYTISNKRDS